MPFTPENVKNFLGNVPLGRLTDPTDVAKAALFLGKSRALLSMCSQRLKTDGAQLANDSCSK